MQETTLGGTWVFARRVQVGLEIPWDVVMPHDAASTAGLSDVGFSTQVLLCCERATGFTFVSVRGEVGAPTGDPGRDLGGSGAFSFSLLAGHGVTVVESQQDLGVQVQLGYDQEIRPTRDEREEADARGSPRVREKQLVWNTAFTWPLLDRRVTPVFEVLGTTTLDAVDRGEEGSSVALGVGVWLAPFADDGPLSPVTFAAGWRWPVGGRRDSDGEALLILEWTFDGG